VRGQWARSAGGFSFNRGTAQTTITHLFQSTSDATPTVLTLNGSTPISSNTFTIVDHQTLSCMVNIVGRKTTPGANDHASFLRQVLIYRQGSTLQIVGSVQTIGTDINPASWGGVALSVDATNNALQISVTGVASTTIRWSATVYAAEVAEQAF
jgi:hypothetical protein